jgi:hypothetical protein
VITIPGLAVVINGIAPAGPTDAGYEYRTIALDAERAWKMREPLERALSWPKGSEQELWWLGAYYAARDAS